MPLTLREGILFLVAGIIFIIFATYASIKYQLMGMRGARIKFIHPFLKFTEKFFFRGTYVSSEVITKLTEVFNKARSIEELCVNLTEVLVTTFKTDKTVFLLKDREGRNFLPAYLRGVIDPSTFTFDSTDELINHARRRKDVFLTEEIGGDTPARKQVLGKLRKHGIDLFIPVEIRGELEGLICLGRKSSDEPYTTRDISLLRIVSDLAGIALENVKLYASLEKGRERS